MSPLVVLFGGISALGGLTGIATFAYVTATRRKINAEAAKLEVEPNVLLSQAAMEMYDRVTARLRETEAKNERLETHVRELETVLREHGITPPRWPPLESVRGDSASPS